MTAFVNGAVSALQKCLNLIKILDPYEQDQNLIDMKNQILIYIQMYKDLDKVRAENPIKDETGEKIKKASTLNEEELDFLENLIAKA